MGERKYKSIDEAVEELEKKYDKSTIRMLARVAKLKRQTKRQRERLNKIKMREL